MKMSDELASRLVQIVQEASREFVLPSFRNLSSDEISTKSNKFDLVTKADGLAEERISERVLELLPDAQIVGEEATSKSGLVADTLSTSELSILIDPIDGTWNFANGLPLFGVILAAVESGRTTFGLHYDPLTDTWIQASVGKGAWRVSSNGAAKRLCIEGQAIGTAGFVPMSLYPKAVQQKLFPRLSELDRVMTLGCSCVEYWQLAEGKVDFGISGLLFPWDHAAGDLIYRESGGFAAMLEDESPYMPGVSVGQLLVARNHETWALIRDSFGSSFC